MNVPSLSQLESANLLRVLAAWESSGEEEGNHFSILFKRSNKYHTRPKSNLLRNEKRKVKDAIEVHLSEL